MRVKGTDRTMVVGKELEIRRILSESHLKSSAFEVVYLDEKGGVTGSDGEWKAVRLDGRGWGHGVGLCQIGAAVMASEGYDYISILNHYYPGADVENK
jgi:SpoIID/LytB domain protein